VGVTTQPFLMTKSAAIFFFLSSFGLFFLVDGLGNAQLADCLALPKIG